MYPYAGIRKGKDGYGDRSLTSHVPTHRFRFWSDPGWTSLEGSMPLMLQDIVFYFLLRRTLTFECREDMGQAWWVSTRYLLIQFSCRLTSEVNTRGYSYELPPIHGPAPAQSAPNCRLTSPKPSRHLQSSTKISTAPMNASIAAINPVEWHFKSLPKTNAQAS
jgi:hypothetical protein